MPYSFEEELNLDDELKGFEDIISLSTCKVSTTIRDRGEESYLCEFHIQVELVLEDAVTFEEIPYKIDVNSSEVFTKDINNLDATIMDKDTLDTREAIIAIIISEKPMTTSLSDYENDDDTEDEYINPAFASLKDLL